MGISRIELHRNGKVVREWKPNSIQAKLTHTVTETQSCWYTVRAFGTGERWQVAVASPIYFAKDKIQQKRDPLLYLVRGRIYDFATGKDRAGEVEIRRQDTVLKTFAATGQFQVRMPIDAEIMVRGETDRPICKNLLLDYGPIHRFLWNLTSADLANEATLDRIEFLTRSVDLEFPLGHRLPGCYVVRPLRPILLQS